MNLEAVNQAKMTFWITMTLKTQYILSYHTPTPGATPILFHPKLVEAISLQKNEIFLNRGNDEYECPWWYASWTTMSNMSNFCAWNYHETYKGK